MSKTLASTANLELLAHLYISVLMSVIAFLVITINVFVTLSHTWESNKLLRNTEARHTVN